ncbi:S8 family serine peptidase [Catellatospora aurea]|uniref:S8 family serine peptidase n=1 Tax=Catellatospora aurea TaxID=1337874 RepID=A0ABW2H4C6_9ACTN
MACALSVGVMLGAGGGTASAARGADGAAAVAVEADTTYIVTLHDSASVRSVGVEGTAKALATKFGGKVGYVYSRVLQGFSVKLNAASVAQMSGDPAVKSVFVAGQASVADTQENPTWGLDRIDQRNRPLSGSYTWHEPGPGIEPKVYVIDTGVRLSHSEFGNRAFSVWDFLNNDPVAEDCHGHGTHVAGTIAGLKYGVNKRARIGALRVFDCSGYGPMEAIVAAYEWVAVNAAKPAVLNASIQIYCGATEPVVNCQAKTMALSAATQGVINAGVPVVTAVGNLAVDACTALNAGVREAIAVGASDVNDNMAGFSNHGPCVDIMAPGVGIVSAFHTGDNQTATMSGSSMAAPHVAGAVSLILQRDGWTNATPQQIEAEIKNMASGVVTSPPLTTNKLLFTDPPSPSGGSSVAVAKHADGRLDVFGVNRHGNLFHAPEANPGSGVWSPWSQSREAGWRSTAAEANQDGRIELVGVMQNEQIWRRRQAKTNIDFWQPWGRLDGALTSVAMARNSDGRLEMFGANAAGETFLRYQTGAGSNTWSAWAQMGLVNVRAIAAESHQSNGRIEVFAVKTSGDIWHRYQSSPSGLWSAWKQLDGGLKVKYVAAARSSTGELMLIAVSPEGRVWTRSQSPGVDIWNGWVPLDTRVMRQVAAETDAQGRVNIFGVEPSGELWHCRQTAPGSNSITPWTAMHMNLRP